MAITLVEEYTNSFPAVRGMQAGKPCYIAMCPMRLVPKLFSFDEETVPPDLRAQRKVNESRIPEIARYLFENTDNYTLSAITASINSQAHFEPQIRKRIKFGTVWAHIGHRAKVGTDYGIRAEVKK